MLIGSVQHVKPDTQVDFGGVPRSIVQAAWRVRADAYADQAPSDVQVLYRSSVADAWVQAFRAINQIGWMPGEQRVFSL